MPRDLAAVNMEGLAGHKGRRLEIENGIDDVRDLAHVSHRMQLSQELIGIRRMHRRFDDAARDGVHADAPLGVFDGERLRRGGEATFRQRSEDGGHLRIGLIDQGRGDRNDMAAARLLHLGDGALRDMEKSGEVGGHDGDLVVLRVLGERLGDEDAGVVDERVGAPQAKSARSTGRRLSYVGVGSLAGGREISLDNRTPSSMWTDVGAIAVQLNLSLNWPMARLAQAPPFAGNGRGPLARIVSALLWVCDVSGSPWASRSTVASTVSRHATNRSTALQ